MSERPVFVYLLRCGDGSLYCGWTFNVDQRLAVHQAGRGGRYTRSRLPLELAAVLELPDESSARREEARIKRLSRLEKLALIATLSAREPSPGSARGSSSPRAPGGSPSRAPPRP